MEYNCHQSQRKTVSMASELVPNKRKSRSVSSFLKKTYQILQDIQNSYAIKWAHNGVGFVVVKQQDFSKEILPKYFKHSNYSSFVRQLNMYNFHKIREANYQSHFHHQFFKRGNKSLLSQIKRKPQKKKRKNDQFSQQEREPQNDVYNDKSDVSMRHRIKNSKNQISNQKINISEVKIKSYKSTADKKVFENTCHIFGSQKQNNHEQNEKANRQIQQLNQQYNEQKQRVSIQNLLSGCQQNEEDKLSINNQLAEGFPRYPTKQIFYPSNNHLYPLPLNLKGGNIISHLNILF